MSGHYSCLVWRARPQSVVGQWLARCVSIERCHVDLKRGETTCKSLVNMEKEKTHWETGPSTLLLALWPSCSIVSSSLTVDDMIHCWVAANAFSAEPCRCLALQGFIRIEVHQWSLSFLPRAFAIGTRSNS